MAVRGLMCVRGLFACVYIGYSQGNSFCSLIRRILLEAAQNLTPE